MEFVILSSPRMTLLVLTGSGRLIARGSTCKFDDDSWQQCHWPSLDVSRLPRLLLTEVSNESSGVSWRSLDLNKRSMDLLAPSIFS